MADQFVGLARTAGTYRIGLGGIGPHIGAALLLGHGHADGDTRLVGHADVARVVFGGEDFRQPLSSQIGLQAQRRHTGEGHGQRATAAGFGLAVQVGHGGACDMGPGLRVRPRQGGQAVLDRRAHQLMISRVKLHQIDAMTEAVMAGEHGLVLIGQEPRFHQRTAGQRTVGIDPRFGPTSTEPPRPLLQRQIDAIQVCAVQRRRLVGHFVGFSELMQVHDGVPWVGQEVQLSTAPKPNKVAYPPNCRRFRPVAGRALVGTSPPAGLRTSLVCSALRSSHP
ncbi:hypothetical protein D3C73_584110 [compost metagenome]